MYTSEDVSVSWHVPNEQEIDFVLQIFRELVEPTLATLEGLLQPGTLAFSVVASASDLLQALYEMPSGVMTSVAISAWSVARSQERPRCFRSF